MSSSSPTLVVWMLRFLQAVGGLAQLAGQTFSAALRGGFSSRWQRRELVYQLEAVAIRSLTIAILTAAFSSMVMTVQFAVQMSRFGVKEYVSSVVSLSLVRELGPVLTALLVGGRVGAGIAAELGSMRVTEQVDAIRAMGADPIRKLVVPRVAATKRSWATRGSASGARATRRSASWSLESGSARSAARARSRRPAPRRAPRFTG